MARKKGGGQKASEKAAGGQKASEKAPVYTPKKVARPPPAASRSDGGWDWWNDASQPVRAQPPAAASTEKWT
eukprot:6473826-Amphidinium_carterae.1